MSDQEVERLGQTVEADLEHWETTAGLAQLLRRPIGTIRRWASEDQWRRRGTSRTREWWYADAQRSLDRRARRT